MDVAKALRDCFITTNPGGNEVNIVDALLYVGSKIKELGINDADTRMGAIELLSKEVKEVGDALHIIARKASEEEVD